MLGFVSRNVFDMNVHSHGDVRVRGMNVDING